MVKAHVLYKIKHDGREKCRFDVMGNLLDKKSASETFTSVVSDEAKLFSLTVMQAHTASRGDQLIITDMDVADGFLHIPLQSSTSMFLFFPANLSHELVGKCVV